MSKIVCSCCGRQIVSYRADDKWVIGPFSGTLNLGFGKVACFKCAPDEIAWERMEEEKQLKIFGD